MNISYNNNGLFLGNVGNLDRLVNGQEIAYLDSLGTLNMSLCAIGTSLNYIDSAPLKVVVNQDSFGQVLLQNKNDGANASMNLCLLNNSLGTDYMAVGINSNNFASYYNTLFEIPNAGYISHSTDLILGPQSDHSSTSRTYLTYADGLKALELNEYGALGWDASYNGTLQEGNFGSAGQALMSSGSAAPPVWVGGLIRQVAYGSGAQTVQSAPIIDLLSATPISFPAAGTAKLTLYFELYCAVAGFQTYNCYLDSNLVDSFQASMSLPNFRMNFTYTFSFAVPSFGTHVVQVQGVDANGLITDINDWYQYNITLS